MSTRKSEGRGASKERRETVTPPPAVSPPQPSSGHSVLIVDDSDTIRGVLRKMLEDMDNISAVVEARDGLEALAALSRSCCDLVITDVAMPRLDGFKLVSAIRQNPKHKDVMIIVLSSRDESVDKVRGLTLGANDYITKPFEQGELQARVSVMFKMKELQRELEIKNRAMEEANIKLAMLANQDGLTGLPNRRFFFERYQVEFTRARRLKSPIGLLMVDIDHFKAFNDTYGHLSGDEALRAIASTIQGSVRTYDLVGRYGGEELIVCLPETDCTDAFRVGERLRTAVEAATIIPTGKKAGDAVSLTVSIGIACWPEVPAGSSDALIEAADTALYRAKSDGRNRCVLAGAKSAPAQE